MNEPTLNADIPADWWVAEDSDRAWLESQEQELQRADDEDDRDPQSFK